MKLGDAISTQLVTFAIFDSQRSGYCAMKRNQTLQTYYLSTDLSEDGIY